MPLLFYKARSLHRAHPSFHLLWFCTQDIQIQIMADNWQITRSFSRCIFVSQFLHLLLEQILVAWCQWCRHGGNGWVRTPPLLFRPLLGFAQIRWKVFFTYGGYPMYAYCNFYCSPAKKHGSDPPPPTFLELATPLPDAFLFWHSWALILYYCLTLHIWFDQHVRNCMVCPVIDSACMLLLMFDNWFFSSLFQNCYNQEAVGSM